MLAVAVAAVGPGTPLEGAGASAGPVGTTEDSRAGRWLGHGSQAAAVARGERLAPAASRRAAGSLLSSAIGPRGAVLVFWATWCGHCLAEFPDAARLHARTGPCGLPVVGVSIDVMPRADFARWIQLRGVGWPQVYEGRGLNGDLARTYGVKSVPHTVLVDTHGRVVAAGLRGEALSAAADRVCASGPAPIAR